VVYSRGKIERRKPRVIAGALVSMDDKLDQNLTEFRKCVVIGGGPTAAAFCAQMRDLNHRVTVCTTGKVQINKLTNRLARPSKTSAKKIWKFVDSDEFLKIRQEQFDLFTHYRAEGIGGLTSRWGGGCSKLTASEIGAPEAVVDQISNYYDKATQLLNVSVNEENRDLADYIGSFPTINNYGSQIPEKIFKCNTSRVTFGFSAQAVNRSGTEDRNGGLACNHCGNCSIVCSRQSFYTAQHTFLDLLDFHEVFLNSTVKRINKTDQGYELEILRDEQTLKIKAEIVVLAAGVIESLKLFNPLVSDPLTETAYPLKHCPLTRGIAVSLKKKNSRDIPGSTVARLTLDDGRFAMISFVQGESIPTSDFLSFLPLKNAFIYSLIEKIKPFLLAHMTFFPSAYTDHVIKMRGGNVSSIETSLGKKFNRIAKRAGALLNKFLIRNGYIQLPRSNNLLSLGSDIHYGGTLPMSDTASTYSTNLNCESYEHQNLYVIDASWMPDIPEKPHTFTLMANAFRVAELICKKMGR